MAINASHRALSSYDRAVCKLSSGCDVCVFHLGHRSCPVLKINVKPAGIIDRHNTEMKWERSLLAANATLTFNVNFLKLCLRLLLLYIFPLNLLIRMDVLLDLHLFRQKPPPLD